MRKKALIEMIVKIILERIRNERGRLTRISNTCKINRGKLTDEAMTHVRFNQLILLFYAVCLNLKPKEFEAMMKDIYYTFVEKSAEYDFSLFDDDDDDEEEKK